MSYGKSLALSQNSFVRPPTPDVVEAQEQDEFGARRQKRQATVYDAVAGRVNHHGFLPSAPYPSKYRDTASSSTRPVRPEEVLFRRQHAPQRYEENDFYFAHEALPPSCPLPCSELLEAIHAYSADFYDHATIDGGRDDYQSMDETALIAMGILMEEMAKESLGETGDMVLVEGEEIPTDELPSVPQLGRNIGRKRANTGQSSTMASSGDELESVVAKKRRPKKRKLGRKMTSAAELDIEDDERCLPCKIIVASFILVLHGSHATILVAHHRGIGNEFKTIRCARIDIKSAWLNAQLQGVKHLVFQQATRLRCVKLVGKAGLSKLEPCPYFQLSNRGSNKKHRVFASYATSLLAQPWSTSRASALCMLHIANLSPRSSSTRRRQGLGQCICWNAVEP
ncbi:hypothetical protein M747DRAFT_335141 [Aspergillus niger ATCC 13496]|uniref:Contig An04c0220, genomic contig n=3 Tax=Aspergillus niger TaxID=5061 RepID=A2QJL4_ASPNC|nr:uncharacterized protein An04g07480 [Aspergillus niger]RDH15518.1 hypothetical protein M747DRAFT_335141 [Aspergillus niger ATCC 13496]CAK38904.1 unnamed protein product [Aspergillus niger]